MKRFATSMSLVLGLVTAASAAPAGVPANPKIGVIDIEHVLAKTATGKKANEQFEATRKAKQAELDKKQQDFKKAQADFEKQRALLKPEVLKQRQEDLEKEYVDLGDLAAKLEKDLATERAKLMQDVLKKAEPLIAEVAKAEGVQIILEQSAVVWIDPAIDLTAKLEAKM
jgi:outer membrane protein